MKKVAFIIINVIFLTSFYVYAEAPFDGTGWKLLNRYIEGRTMRKVLLHGIYDGASITQAEKAKEVYSASDFEKLALMVDDFYSDDNNLSIPVTHAYYVVSMQVKNVPNADIQEAIKKFRAGYRMQFIKKTVKGNK